jgi:hypothetical protein
MNGASGFTGTIKKNCHSGECRNLHNVIGTPAFAGVTINSGVGFRRAPE